MNRNQVLPQVELSTTPDALRKVDFCASHPYKGGGFLEISMLPRIAQDVSKIEFGDGFHWKLDTHFEDVHGGEPRQIVDLELNGRLHKVCQRCLKDCSLDLVEKRQFIMVPTEAEADEHPIEDDYREPLVASQQFDLLEAIEDEILLSLPLIPKHPEGTCEPHASSFGDSMGELEAPEKPKNPFNILKDIKKI